jgi:hypothetical protein
MRFRTRSFSASLAPRLCQLMGSARISASLASSASISARVDIVQPFGARIERAIGRSVLRTPGTPRDNLLPGRRASSGRWSRRAAGRPRRRCTPPGVCRRPFRTVTRAPVLSSVMVSCRAVRSPRGRGSLTFIGSRSQSGSFARCEGRLHHLGRTLLALEGDTHTRHRWPDRRSRQPSTLQARYAIWACHCFTSVPPASRSSAAPSARPSAARRSTAPPPTSGRPALVAIKPGGTVTFRIAGGQTHPVGSGQAPPGDRRFDASKCQPRTSPRSGTLAR